VELLSTETAIVLALGEGPASGSELAQRVKARLGTARPASCGTLYPALERLRRDALVLSWIEQARSRPGRPLRFHELTARGVAALGARRAALRRLADSAGSALSQTRPVHEVQLRNNLQRAFAASAVGVRLRAELAVSRVGRDRVRSR
jgi:DNA-binding PadR family transcriptional regulator